MIWRIREFCHTHRYKLLLSAAVAVIGGACIWWTATPVIKYREEEKKEGDEHMALDNLIDISSDDLRDRNHQQIAIKRGVRNRLLLRVRRHFDYAGKHFFPTLRLKIVETVDIANAIQQIKQVRSGGLLDKASKSTEANLWDQIKVSSFVLLFTVAYSVSVVATVLRLQLHILARNATAYNDDEGTNTSPSEIELRYLIDSTFRHIFSDGLKNLVDFLRVKIDNALVDWTVREKISVQFVEFVDTVSYIRKSVEMDMRNFVDTIMCIPSFPEVCNESSKFGYSLEELFSQSADIFESQMFRAVLLEAFDCSFRLIIADLKDQFFQDNSSAKDANKVTNNSPNNEGGIVISNAENSTSSMQHIRLSKSPPLATLLPQIKSSALRFLPHIGIGEGVNEIVIGPTLSTLCSAIIDSTSRSSHELVLSRRI
jgi:hypothetical protein